MSAAQGFIVTLICVLVSLHSHITPCNAMCYFPSELQGEFVMQSSGGGMRKSDIQYSKVNITVDSIPIWGMCHKRTGNNFMLLDGFTGDNCFRCLHITLKSKNVLLVKSEGLGKCYISEVAAEASCLHSKAHHTTELLLFKEKETNGDEISKSFCPVRGKFTFVYNIDEGIEDKMECAESVSVIDSCAGPNQGSSVSMHFQGCSFGQFDNITFQCLGDWEGPGNQRYVAFLNPNEASRGKPRYRCALYHMDKSGKVYLAFSNDSTCTSNLSNSTAGYETMVLTPTKEEEYPPKVLMSVCRFPEWMQGTWENLNVNGPVMSFADHTLFRMFHIRCIGTPNPATNQFPVFIRDQCGGGGYNCIWIEKRAPNVLEFQLGMIASPVYNESLCIDKNFPYREWTTQGRLDKLDESPCPITGEYTGVIPDNSGLCAKLSSDCKSKEIMYYTMSECEGSFYEGRITKISRSKRDTGSSMDDKVYHVTNPRPSYTVQTELESTSPTTFLNPTIATNTLNSTEITKPSTTTPLPTTYSVLNETPSVENSIPRKSSERDEQLLTTLTTPFNLPENKSDISTENQESESVSYQSETASISTTSSYGVSSIENSSVTNFPQNSATVRGNIDSDKLGAKSDTKYQLTSSAPSLDETKSPYLFRNNPSTTIAYFSDNSSQDYSGFQYFNQRDQVTNFEQSRRVTDSSTNYQQRPYYGTTTRMTPVTFHGSISEIPFQGGFGYPNTFKRPSPPLGPTQYNYNRNWMDQSQNNGYPQYRIRQEPGRYMDQNPYPVTTAHPDQRRAWQMRVAESHPIFVSNNRKILPIQSKTPIALPPIQIPPPNLSNFNRRLPLASSTTTPLREGIV